MNFKRLVMFKLFQEVCELQRSSLILSVGGLEFVTDEVPEQAVISSFFFRRLMIFCPHVLARCYCPQSRIERKIIMRVERCN